MSEAPPEVPEIPAPAEAAPETPAQEADDDIPELIQDTLHRLKAYHVKGDELTMQELWEGAARGLVEAVDDPYTVFQSAEERDDWQDHLTKEYGGIGAYVGYDKEGFFIVTRPMYGGPAWKARLQSGDRVISVDGWSTTGQDLNDIVTRVEADRQGRAGKGLAQVPKVDGDITINANQLSGTLLGVLFGLGATAVLSQIVTERTDILVESTLGWSEIHLAAAFLGATSLLSLLPAIVVLRQPVVDALRA